MMSNVIAFPEPTPRPARKRTTSNGAVTLFIHIRCTTLIAHLTGRIPTAPVKGGRVGKS